MKSFVAAALISMVSANPGLLQGLIGDDSILAHIVLPAGIDITALVSPPKQAPGPGQTWTWHPSHHGMDMDGCDDQGNDDWHYVHECDECKHNHHTWTTSTATNTITKTVIDCAPTVTDCPARTTEVTTVTTTICPATVTASTTTEVPVTTQVPVTTVTPVVPVTSTPCPETTTMAPPPPPPSTMTTSPCPPTTKAPAPPATVVVPPYHPNNTWTQPPVVVGGASQAQVGILAAIAAVVALL